MSVLLSEYVEGVLQNFNQSQTINNTKVLINNILTHKSIQL